MDKPFSQACENNKRPILAVLAPLFREVDFVLEVGSGTGQHAVFFARQMPWLRWQPSDVAEHLPGIALWCREAALPNLLAPIALDVGGTWPVTESPALFTANTLHIMRWPLVEQFFTGAGQLLGPGGLLAVYGPFNYDGQYTSPSNASFDSWLKARDPASGIRDKAAVDALAEAAGLAPLADHAMPANNRLLVWQKV